MATTATVAAPERATVGEVQELRERVGRLERQHAAMQAVADASGGSLRLQVSDKTVIRAVMQQVLAELGLPTDWEPDITPEENQRLMVEEGLDPNECLISREIIARREGRL